MTGPRPREDLAELVGYHSPQVDVDVRLNTNESPYPPPAAFVEALADAARRLVYHRYPDRDAAGLRAALGRHLGVEPESLFCANGSNEVIQVLLLAFGGAERTALLFTPTYSMHTKIAEATGTRVASAPRDVDFAVSPEEVVAACDRHDPHVVFFCSPNNPSGNLERRDAIEAAAADSRRLVVVDEAYGEFCADSALGVVSARTNVVVVRTMSKAWSMPALRLGYMVAPPQLVHSLGPAHLPYHLNAFTQEAGRIALRFAHETESRVALINEERGHLYSELASCSDVTVWPSAANFLLFRPDAMDASDVWAGLVERGVLVRNFSALAGTAGCLRVTVGTPEENTRFLDALTDVLAGGA